MLRRMSAFTKDTAYTETPKKEREMKEKMGNHVMEYKKKERKEEFAQSKAVRKISGRVITIHKYNSYLIQS